MQSCTAHPGAYGSLEHLSRWFIHEQSEATARLTGSQPEQEQQIRQTHVPRALGNGKIEVRITILQAGLA
eukprot:6466503-Amphidinium_carterae.1